MESNTPLTDAAEKWTFGDNRIGMSFDCVTVEFAQQLETDFNARIAGLEKLDLVKTQTYNILEQELRRQLREANEALTKIANYDGESIWMDDRDDAANDMLRIAQRAIERQ